MATPTWASLREGALKAIEQIQNGGKSVMYNGRANTMADIPDLLNLIEIYDKKIAEGAGKRTRSRVSYITPVV